MDIASELQKTELFQEVDAASLAALADSMKQRSYDVGTVLFNAGMPGNSMYIIVSGRVRIYTVDDGHELTLMHYSASEIFGEFALLDNKPRSASASVVEPLDALILHRDDFMTFLKERPQVSLAMMRSLSQRARYTTEYVEEIVQWARRLASGDYQEVIRDISAANDEGHRRSEIPGLIAAFLQMARKVQEREEELKQEIVRMRVQIDQEDRENRVTQITSTDFFSSLKEQARQMRAETGEYPTNLADPDDPENADD